MVPAFKSVLLGEEMFLLTAGMVLPREGVLLHKAACAAGNRDTRRVGCPPDLSIRLPEADNPIINSQRNGTRSSRSLRKIRIV